MIPVNRKTGSFAMLETYFDLILIKLRQTERRTVTTIWNPSGSRWGSGRRGCEAIAVGIDGSRRSNERELTVGACTAAETAAMVFRDCVRKNAEDLIAWILHQEIERFLVQFRGGNAGPNVVRNGFQPERSIMTGLGMLTVRYPKARSKNGNSVAFRSQLVPKYVHCAQHRSDVAEWKCLDAVQHEDLAGILRAMFGERADQVTYVVPDLAARWTDRVRAWKQRSLVEHSAQDLWMLSIATPTCPEGLKLLFHVVIAVAEGGTKRILCIATGRGDSPLDEWGTVVESIQNRGLACPGRIFSNWRTSLLSDSLRRVAPQWAARVVTRVVTQESERTERTKSSLLLHGWDWPVVVH